MLAVAVVVAWPLELKGSVELQALHASLLTSSSWERQMADVDEQHALHCQLLDLDELVLHPHHSCNHHCSSHSCTLILHHPLELVLARVLAKHTVLAVTLVWEVGVRVDGELVPWFAAVVSSSAPWESDDFVWGPSVVSLEDSAAELEVFELGELATVEGTLGLHSASVDRLGKHPGCAGNRPLSGPSGHGPCGPCGLCGPCGPCDRVRSLAGPAVSVWSEETILAL